MEVVFECAGASPGIKWSGRAAVGYDGLVWVEVTATPARANAEISRLRLRAPVRNSKAILYSIAAAYPGGRSMPNAPAQGGRLPKEGWAGAPVPQIWVGNYELGVALYAHEPVEQDPGVSGDAMRLDTSQLLIVEMQMDFIRRPTALQKPRTFRFGLQPTPARPRSDRPEPRRMAPLSLAEDNAERHLQKLAESGAELILIEGARTQPGGAALIREEDAARAERIVAAAHRLGLKAILTIPLQRPDTAGATTALVDTGIRLTSQFAEQFVERLDRAMNDMALDGICLDTRRFTAAPLLERRAFHERLYRMLHSKAEAQGILYIVSSDPALFIFDAFADVRLCGTEHYDALARHGAVRRRLPDLDSRLPADRYLASTGVAALGRQPAFSLLRPDGAPPLSVLQGADNRHATTDELLTIHESFALAGLLNMHVAAPPEAAEFGKCLALQSQLWELEDRLMPLSPRVLGYWQTPQYLRTEPLGPVQVSAWIASGDRALLHVANLTAKRRRATVKFLPQSGYRDPAELEILATAVPDGGSAEASGDTITCDLPPNGFIRLLVE